MFACLEKLITKLLKPITDRMDKMATQLEVLGTNLAALQTAVSQLTSTLDTTTQALKALQGQSAPDLQPLIDQVATMQKQIMDDLAANTATPGTVTQNPAPGTVAANPDAPAVNPITGEQTTIVAPAGPDSTASTEPKVDGDPTPAAT